MKAVLYEKNSADVLVLRDTDKPLPGDKDVLVRVAAASFNAADYRSLKMGLIPKSKIFGSDISGRITAIGKDVKKFAVGDEVCGETAGCGFGGFAEFAAIPERVLALKPEGLTFETAAAIPLASCTALQALRKGGIRSGQRVAVYGAGGGVGTFAVQLARYFGAEVTAVCGPKNAVLMKSIGADHIVDYTKMDFMKNGRRYDLILAVNGKSSISAYKRMLNPKGICVMVGGALSQVLAFMLLGSVISLGGRKLRLLTAKANADDLAFILNLVKEGKITPVIDRHYPLHETAEAFRYIREGHAKGKIVIGVAVKR